MHEVLLGSIPYSTLEEITKQRLSLPNFLSKGKIKLKINSLNKEVICFSVLLKTRTMFRLTDCKHLLRWCLRKNPDLRPSLEEIQRHPWFQ